MTCRSTKAGARTPATLTASARYRPPSFSAQRRPGREPRRHVRAGLTKRDGPRAQRRPGREPRRHPSADGEMCSLPIAQRRPGREPRRHSLASGSNIHIDFAQRRPGREPRRHVRQVVGERLPARIRSTKAGARTPATPRRCGRAGGSRGARSTKAGARTPATRRSSWPLISPSTSAQRRPGREPRRHLVGTAVHRGPPDRSTKAGARTPATLLPGRRGARVPLRSTKAGARTPATQALSSISAAAAAAQRRPGREPRRHSFARAAGTRIDAAQRRPGREPRRHRCPHHRRDVGHPRSTKAGARTPATRTGPRGC